MSRTKTFLAALAALAFPSLALAQPAAHHGTGIARSIETSLAIQHGRLRLGDGHDVEDATIVVRGERVVSVAAGGAVPAGMTTIDATGMTVTAGFVSLMTPIGLGEIELEESSMDIAEEGDHADAIRAAFSAADAFNPYSTLIPVARLGGVTTALSVPEGGLVPGTSAWVDLASRVPSDVIHDDTAALHVSFDDGGFSAAHGARSTAITALRELLDDARLYARSRAQYDRGQFRTPSSSVGDVSRLDLERVAAALAGEMPVVVRTARASDILRVLALADEYDLTVVLSGAEEGWMVAQEIAAAHVPVIVEPLANLPSRFSALHTRYDNAALLAMAGVDVMIMSPGAWDVHNVRQEAGNAVANGMEWDAALRAVTSLPARVFGMDEDYGTVAAGKLANLVVWSGDPFELTTAVRHVVIRGHDVPLTSRQTDLFERYRSLESVPRGYHERWATPAAPPPEADETEGAADDDDGDD
ncbi:MAG: amidohydrolase family protein [Sandaracinus sp.]